jgi:asparagine synthetase B (glutamine-hydrolysing)
LHENEFNEYLYALEDFDYESIILFKIFAKLKGKYKVSISGHGADEIFLGYQLYKHKEEYLKKAKQRLENIKDLISKKKISEYNSIIRKLENSREFANFMIKHELPNIQLEIVDKLSMYFSIENRVPFLKESLVNQVKKIPFSDLNTTIEKEILRNLFVDEVPNYIVNRRKLMSGRSTTPTIIKDIESMAISWFKDKQFDDFSYSRLIDSKELFSMFEDNIEKNTKKYGLSQDLRKRIITKIYCIEKIKEIFLEG